MATIVVYPGCLAELEVSNPGALKLIRQIEDEGWLEHTGTRGGRHYWLAREVLSIVSGDEPPT